MSDSEVDPSFSVLPARLKRRIDGAFDNAIIQDAHSAHDAVGPSRKKRKLSASTTGGGFITSEAGGFLIEESVAAPGGFLTGGTGAGGGFITEDDISAGDRTSESSEDEDAPAYVGHTHIPISLIPAALQLLDLQPDDPDIIAVFHNAATGWEGTRGSSTKDDGNLRVSRKDWRAVCAALLDASAAHSDDGGVRSDAAETEEIEVHEDTEEESEEYVDSSEGEENGADSDDEYQESGFIPTTSSKAKRKSKTSPQSHRKRTRELPADSDPDSEITRRSRSVTGRQREECRRTFAMFFPEVPDDKLDTQKIMIKDISRIAALLKEKITAEEIIEMLEAFSTSADKSMSLSDFETMMITAKLA